jgi:hypothetical protein
MDPHNLQTHWNLNPRLRFRYHAADLKTVARLQH